MHTKEATWPLWIRIAVPLLTPGLRAIGFLTRFRDRLSESRRRWIGPALAVGLFLGLAACGGTAAEPEVLGEAVTTDQTVEPDSSVGGTSELSGDLDATVEQLLVSVSDGYERIDGEWPGFVPNEYPTAFPVFSGGELISTILLNHPNPGAVGEAVALDTTDLAFDSAHRVDTPTDPSNLELISSYELWAPIGDVESFAVRVDPDDPTGIFDPADPFFPVLVLHEMFHRYQFDNWLLPLTEQDIDGYAWNPENLELALLEELALDAAVTATDDEARTEAAEHFLAIRQTRLANDDRVNLDEFQELIEGTARYIEHALGYRSEDFGTDTLLHNEDNFDADLTRTFTASSLKEEFGVGRFYGSGAAVTHLIRDDFGVADASERLQNGESPSEILSGVLQLDAPEIGALVVEARATYDPDGEIVAQSVGAAERARNEPAYDFESDAEIEGEDLVLDEEQAACFEALGVDFNDPESAVGIPIEDLEECFGEEF